MPEKPKEPYYPACWEHQMAGVCLECTRAAAGAWLGENRRLRALLAELQPESHNPRWAKLLAERDRILAGGRP